MTDTARYKDTEHTDSIIQNWMRNRNTVELLGFWETIYNQNFKKPSHFHDKFCNSINSSLNRLKINNSIQRIIHILTYKVSLVIYGSCNRGVSI
nr:KilA-N domain-containing protein [Chryseobacterium sp. HMWF035]